MELKKKAKPEVSNKRIDFFLLGLALSLGLVFYAFTYRLPVEKVQELPDVVIDEDLVVMENTVQEKKPPPPPPPPEIEVVEDDEEIIDDQPEIVDNDLDQDDAIDDYQDDDDNDEPDDTDEIFEVYDVSEKATFPGGEDGLQRYLTENAVFPPMAVENDIQGTINVIFVVDKQGKVKDVAILGQKKGFGLEEEAMRVVRSTSGMWKPAKQTDKPVNMRFRIPVKFQMY